LGGHHFGAVFNISKVQPLRQFVHEWKNASYEFQDKNIEAKKRELHESATKVNALIAEYADRNHKKDHDWLSIKKEFDNAGWSLHQHKVDEINKAANEFFEDYQRFIKLLRERLGDGTF